MPKAARTRMRGTGAAGDAARAAHKANSAGGPGAAGMVDRRTGGRQRGKTGVFYGHHAPQEHTDIEHKLYALGREDLDTYARETHLKEDDLRHEKWLEKLA